MNSETITHFINSLYSESGHFLCKVIKLGKHPAKGRGYSILKFLDKKGQIMGRLFHPAPLPLLMIIVLSNNEVVVRFLQYTFSDLT